MVATRRRRLEPTSDPHKQLQPSLTQFFKVVLPSGVERKMLRIPPKFVKNFGSELSEFATLRTPAGFKRQIRLKRVGEEIWLDGGWCDFADYHSISAGHFLVFDYRGNSDFKVLIFDKTACEINYPHDYIDISRVDEWMEDESERFLSSQGTENVKNKTFNGSDEYDCTTKASSSGSSAYYEPEKSGGSVNDSEEDESYESEESWHMKMDQDENAGFTVRKRFKKSTQGKSVLYKRNDREKFTKLKSNGKTEPFEAHEEGNKVFMSQKIYMYAAAERNRIHEAEMLKLENPSFMIIIRLYNFTNSYVHVPSRFVGRYLTKAVEQGFVEDPKKRKWQINMIREREYMRLSKGWIEIAKANDLKEGDICIFELVETGENTGFRLHIFSAEGG